MMPRNHWFTYRVVAGAAVQHRDHRSLRMALAALEEARESNLWGMRDELEIERTIHYRDSPGVGYERKRNSVWTDWWDAEHGDFKDCAKGPW